jgi:hypothetical protein
MIWRRAGAVVGLIAVAALFVVTAVSLTASAEDPPRTITAFVTGYTFADNDPPGSDAIARPRIHARAGGTGTYSDPITLAVYAGTHDPGTLFYIPHVRRYFIVEDDCATCARIEWLDMWIGGTPADSYETQDRCARSLTGTYRVEVDPPADRPVDPGPLLDQGRCYLEQPVPQEFDLVD